MKLSFRRGISQKLEYTYNGEKAMYETVLEKGKGWQVIFRRNPQRYIILTYLCSVCRHRITWKSEHGRVFWRHFYSVNYAEKPRPHRVCYCGCERPVPPSIEEQMKAYKRLAYWRHQFQVHRTAFFEGKIGKRGN